MTCLPLVKDGGNRRRRGSRPGVCQGIDVDENAGAPVWMRLDLRTEGTRALEMMLEQLEQVVQGDDPYRWKWVILAAHNALQAFMAQAVAGTTELGHLTDKYQMQWEEAYEKGERPAGEPRMAGFMELFQRVQSDRYMKRFVHSKKLQPSRSEAAAVSKLNYWRGEFVHYKKGSLSVEVGGYPAMLNHIIRVIRFLVDESGQVYFVKDELETRTRVAIERADELTAPIQTTDGKLLPGRAVEH